MMKYAFLSILVVLFSGFALAQTAKPVAKATTPPAKAIPPPSKATTTPATTQPAVDDLVHTSSTKVVTLHDPEYKSSPKYAKSKQKYDKTFDDTASKVINYPDGSKLHLKMVKNPSFGGMPTSIKSTTAKGSEKKETKTDKGTQWDCSSSSVALTASS